MPITVVERKAVRFMRYCWGSVLRLDRIQLDNSAQVLKLIGAGVPQANRVLIFVGCYGDTDYNLLVEQK